MNTYDLSTERYADFVVDELLPYLTERYHLNLSPQICTLSRAGLPAESAPGILHGTATITFIAYMPAVPLFPPWETGRTSRS